MNQSHTHVFGYIAKLSDGEKFIPLFPGTFTQCVFAEMQTKIVGCYSKGKKTGI
jgi:hypothetical protein